MFEELPDDEPWPEFAVPELTVYPNEVEPLIPYAVDGSVLVSWTPPVGFARVLE